MYANYEPPEMPSAGVDYPQMVLYFFRGGSATGNYKWAAPLIAAIRAKAGIWGRLVRAKANLNFNTTNAAEPTLGAVHVDAMSGTSVVFYVHSHESGTVFPLDGGRIEKVPAVGNTAVVFDGNAPHGMVLPTSVTPRFVVNMVFDESTT